MGFVAGVEFALQPLLFKNAQGGPLYAPYPLPVAISAMVVPYMLVAAVVESVLTALVIAYLQRFNVKVLESTGNYGGASESTPAPRLGWLWVGLATLALITPLGLLAPGTAWGEWSTAELSRLGLTAIPT